MTNQTNTENLENRSDLFYNILVEIRDIAAAVRDHLADLNTLGKKRKLKAAQQARYRAHKFANVVDTTDNVDTTKETESGKEEISPLESPKGEKGKEKEKRQHHHTRARARGEMTEEEILAELDRIEKEICVSLELAQCWAKCLIVGSTPEMVAEWYAARRAAFWKTRNGQRILNWGENLTKWVRNDALIKKARDPERIPDARKAGTSNRRKADNFRPTEGTEVGDVLG